MKRLLFSPDPAGGGAPQTAAQINDPQTGRVELPPAAATVIDAEVTEELLRERKKREEAEARLKKVETDAAHLADENHRLKNLEPPAPKDERTELEKFMAGEL